MTIPDYYDILGIQRHTPLTKKQIDRAYRLKLREIHPDQIEMLEHRYKEANDETLMAALKRLKISATDQMDLIRQAYETLSDPIRKSDYDRSHYPSFSLSQPGLDFGFLKQGEIRTETVSVINHGTKYRGYTLLRFESPTTWIQLELNSRVTGNYALNQWIDCGYPLRLRVTVDTTNLPTGEYFAKLLIEVDARIIPIPIILKVKELAVLTLDKSSLEFGLFEGGEKSVRVITVNNQGGPPDRFEVRWAEAGLPQPKPKLIPIRGNQLFPLKVQVTVDTARYLTGNYRHHLLFIADNKTIAIPVHFMVQGVKELEQEVPMPIESTWIQSQEVPPVSNILPETIWEKIKRWISQLFQ